MATKPPSLHDLFINRSPQTQSDVAYSNLLDDRDPTQARQARQVGREIGLPGPTIEADLPGFKQEADNNRNLDMLGSDPSMTRFLVDPHNAAATKDDLPSLSEISSIFNMSDEPLGNSAFLNYMKRTQGGQRGRLLSSAAPSAAPYTFANAGRPVAPKFYDTPVPPLPRRVTLPEWMQGITSSVFANVESAGMGAALAGADAIGKGAALQKSGVYRSLNEQMLQDQATAQYVSDINPTWIGKQAYGASQSLALMGAAILTKKPILSLAGQAGGQEYQQVRDRGGSANKALAAGTVTGVAEGAFEKYFGLGWMLGNVGKAVEKKAMGRFVSGLLMREVPSEVATTAVQDLADALVTGGEGWASYVRRHTALDKDNPLIQTAAQTAIMVGLAGGPALVAQHLTPERRAIDDIGKAQAGGEFLDALMTAAEKSKTRKEDPETLRDFVEQRTQDSPVRNVYLPIEAAVEYMQSDQYGGELDHYQDQIAQAQATQGDVVIPVSDAVAHLSGTPAWEALKDEVRVEPGGLSRKEATAKHAEIIATLEQRGKEIAAEAESEDARKSAASEVYVDVKNRLRVAGIDDKQADAVAQIYAARYEARASRRGGTPMEQFKASNIVFPGESTDGTQKGRVVAQEEVMRGLPRDVKAGGETVRFGPLQAARQAARRIATKAGIYHNPPRAYAQVDAERGARIAQAFEEMQHNPNDPTTKAAYRAMIDETLDQFHEIMKTGLKIEFIKGEDPYGNPRNAIRDVVDNNHLWVYPTEAGFGSRGADVAGNPLLEKTGIKIDGHELLANDVFRIVHDYFGHVMEGVGFRASGEENAWRIHSAMYTPLARRAMTTETRGQNSWVNFGPFGEANRVASGADTVYADQKIGLLPEWVSNEGLDDRTLDQTATIGGYEGLAPYLTDEEKDKLREASKAKIMAIAETLPDAEEMAAVAHAGRAKRGWYENSAQAILDVFGAADAPRFAALLAALSPQTSVQSNLYNALKTWTNWNEAGRPTDRKSIVEIMGKSVQGGKGTGSILSAWINNAVTALTAENPAKIKLSGPKVDSFMNNLMGVVDEVTNDTWMANYAGVDPVLFKKTGTNKGPGYKAMAAVTRATADILTKRTGELWTPAEVQETVWSLAKTLYETRDQAGENRTMRELLEAGHVTHDDIANTPDFGVLFADGIYRTILEEAGYGQALGRNRRAVGVAGQASVASEPAAGFGEDAYRQFLAQAADRLEGVRARRLSEGYQRRGDPRQRELFQDVMPEPGWTLERVSGLVDQYGLEDGSSAAVAVMMSPDEYLGLMASAEGRRVIEQRVAQLDEYGPLDMERLRASPPIVLRVALGGENDTRPPPMVRGHDGRHRMMMLKAAGIARAPVVVQLTDKDGKPVAVKEPTDIRNILANRSRADQLSNGDIVGAIERGLPISFKYADQIAAMGQRTLNQEPQPIFYSALERAIASSPQAKASAEQWIATLRKTPGVKQEELEWSGLLDFLAMNTGPITKAQLQELLAEGGVQTEEVVLGRTDAEKLADYGFTVEDLEAGEEGFEDPALIVAEGETQFASWSSDPNNPTYRELLITLPQGVAGNPARAPSTHWDVEGVVAHARFMDKTDADGKRVLFIEEVQSDWHQKGRDQGYEQAVDPETIKAARAELDAREKVANQMRLDFIAAVDELVLDARERNQPGVVGLKLPSEAADSDALKRAYAENVMEKIGDSADPQRYQEAYHEARALAAAELRENEAAQALANTRSAKGIPNAPFKATWPALVMKRMIRWAADNGYDKIAWTTGEEQASRYNLEKHIGRITFTDNSSGGIGKADLEGPTEHGTLTAYDPDGRQIYSQHVYPERDPNAIADVIGRELADKLLAADPQQHRTAGLGVRLRELSGLDLKTGGEGMKAFYDRNLVNITNDIIKKYGAKVGQVPLAVDGADVLDTPAGRDLYEAGLEARKRFGRDSEEIVAIDKRWRELKAQFEAQGDPHPGFEITDKMRDAALAGLPLFQDQEGPRGQVTLQDSGAKIIQLFATANRSTLLHETGHIWLEELRADATAKDATDQDKADWKTVTDWFARNNAPLGKKGFIPRNAHEMWARGVERYFMEGKPPTEGLRGVFKTFRAWLLRVYQVVQNLNSPITPEVREVMDRLLATQDAIDEARRNNDTAPLFKSAEDAGMTDAEFADYQSRVGNARDEAYDALLYKTMESIRRQRSAEVRSERASIRSEVGDMLNRQPQFRLLHLLRTGKWLGEPDRPAQPIKLNSGWLIDNYGEDVLDKLPRGIQLYKASGEDGDTVAEIVGMKSGAEVVQTLLGMRAASDELRARGETRSMRDMLIAEEVDRIMAERHGDALDDGTIEEEAIAALNTARQGEIIASEARQLAKRKNVLGVPTPYQFAREWARRTVAAGHVRDVASRAAMQRYIRASNKSARAAEQAILAGDIDEAYRQKQAQLLNHALLAESKAAAERVDKIVERMRKLAKRAGMKSIDPEYMQKIHMLLENYDFRPRSQRSIDEQEDFQEWLERQRAQGFEVHIPPRLENSGDPYTRVSVQELESLNDLIESLLHLGRTKQKLTIARNERDFAEFRDEVVARLQALPTRKLTKREWRNGLLRKIPTAPINEPSRPMAAAAAELLKVETIVEEIDGGPTGPMHDAIVLGATNAENKRFDLRARVLLPLAKMYHDLGRKQWKRLQERVTIPELTWNSLNEGDPRTGTTVTLTRMELLSVLMNMGNLSNLEKLSKGERWPVETLRAVMDREMTKEDYDLAQKLWDQVGLLWPEIVATEREQAGVVPEKVVNSPIETRFGTYAGGYWPVVYDPARWQLAEDLEGKQIDDMFGIKTGVATQKGHTITRTGAYGPIQLSLENVLFRHIEQVVTRIAFAGYARDVLRIVRDRSIRGWIDTKLGSEYRKQIEKWLARQVHEGAVHAKAARWWDGLMRQARVNVTIAAMGFRFSTGIAQTLGLTASAQRIGAKWVGVGMKRLALSPRESVAFVYARSPELLHRTEAVNREVAEVARKMRGKHGVLTEAQHWAMWHIGFMDRYTVALPTWLGAHTKGMAEGMTDEEASAYADKSVRQSQGSGREKDLSAIQSPNSETMRFFTMFYTPWNVMFNAQWQGVRGLKRGDVRPMAAVTWWWLVVSMLGDALLSGDWPKDAKEPWDWAAWAGRNFLFGIFAGIPLLRDGANFAESQMIGQFASDVGTTPITRIADAIQKAVKSGKKVAKGEEVTRPIKQTGDLTSVLLGVPLSQAGTTGQFAWDKAHGNIDPETLSDWYFGITRDKKPKKDKEAAQ